MTVSQSVSQSNHIPFLILNTATLGITGMACEYKCGAGLKAIANDDHTPSSNGCGSGGLRVNFGNLFDSFTGCYACTLLVLSSSWRLA